MRHQRLPLSRDISVCMLFFERNHTYQTGFFPAVSDFHVSTFRCCTFDIFSGGVPDSTLCRSVGLHVGDDGGSVSNHLKN